MSTAQKPIEDRVSKADATRAYVNSLIPNGSAPTPSILEEAEEVLKTPGQIFVRYLRKGPKLMTEVTEDDNTGDEITEFSLVRGRPIAVMVAFKGKDENGADIVRIGWAKRNQAKKDVPDLEEVADQIVRGPHPTMFDVMSIIRDYTAAVAATKNIEIPFHKTAAKRVAVMRALTDQIFMKPNSSVMTTESGQIIPRILAKKALGRFITDAQAVFPGLIADNVVIELTETTV